MGVDMGLNHFLFNCAYFSASSCRAGLSPRSPLQERAALITRYILFKGVLGKWSASTSADGAKRECMLNTPLLLMPICCVWSAPLCLWCTPLCLWYAPLRLW